MKKKNKKSINSTNFKVVFIGPPDVGKTTIKKTFFDYFNPINLLNHPLEPTKGVNFESYSLFNSKIGLFDLAGQELDSWLGDRSEILIDTDILVIVFDVSTKLNFIDEFLDKIIKIRKKTCNQSKLFILLHKIDLISKFDEIKRTKELINLVNSKDFGDGLKKIFTTSITQEYFISTYKKIEYIIRTLIQDDIIEISPKTYYKLQAFFKLLFMFDRGVKYSLETFKNKLKLNDIQLNEMVDFLKYLELIDIEEDFFKISERGETFYKFIENLPSKSTIYKEIEKKILEEKKKILDKEKIFNLFEEIRSSELSHVDEKIKDKKIKKKKIKNQKYTSEVEESLLSLIQFIEDLKNKENKSEG